MKKTITVTDKSKGVYVPVAIHRDINGLTAKDLIEKCGIFEKIITYHYNVNQIYRNVDDIYSDSLVDYVSDILYDYAKDDNFQFYEELAQEIVDMLQDKVVAKIIELDDEARAE